MRKIIHNKYNLNTMDFENLRNIHTLIQKQLGEDYIVITTPTELNIIDGDVKIITIDCKEYSYNELMDVVNKADCYDDLCK